VALPGFGLSLRAIDVPGHTLGHVAWHAAPFGGDPGRCCSPATRCSPAACGRLFEGTPQQMLDSLARLATLPADTLVYCAHEYTLSNLRFAQACEPDNPAVAERLAEAQAIRARDLETVPTAIGIERNTNPFLRWREPAIRQVAGLRVPGAADDAAVFAAIRAWKNDFR
jgi:hydroxyacylglutathione hydrolase